MHFMFLKNAFYIAILLGFKGFSKKKKGRMEQKKEKEGNKRGNCKKKKDSLIKKRNRKIN